MEQNTLDAETQTGNRPHHKLYSLNSKCLCEATEHNVWPRSSAPLCTPGTEGLQEVHHEIEEASNFFLPGF